MFEILESLPAKEKKEFMEQDIDNIIEFFQDTFNALAISFATAVLNEWDMMERSAEPVRQSLTWIDATLVELKGMRDDYEASGKAIKKSKEEKK